AFLEVARSRDLGEVIEYRTMSGIECSNTLQEILLHVINHGTYHRGQIRGMVDPAKTDQIPDTDLFYFLPGRG
ncbi:MAG TPA: DinB family protein, partial [Fimbriimonas sp.]